MSEDQRTIARLYVLKQTAESVVLSIPGTNYQLHLAAAGTVTPSPQGRIVGRIKVPVWKIDVITDGGAFVEPVFGRPRRVQGRVCAVDAATNQLTVDVCGQPIIGLVPERWNVADFAIGSRVGMDVKEGGVFEPLEGDLASAFGPSRSEVVNLRVG